MEELSLYAAVDLGASSGRIAVGHIQDEKIVVREVHRFTHEAQTLSDGSIRWEWEKIVHEVLFGLNKSLELGPIKSLGIDSWAVDYGLLGSDGKLTEIPYTYRDGRTDGVTAQLQNEVGREFIYSKTGIQFIFLNTVNQLYAAKGSTPFKKAKVFLMLPDLLNYVLCGKKSNEVTNASSTQLLNARTQEWDWELIKKVGIPKSLFPKLHKPKSIIGKVRGHGAIDGIKVVAVGSHDTASAVAGTPLNPNGRSAYISSGTWSLVGLELNEAVTTQKAMDYNITNEVGVDGRIRFIRNVTGMWLLEESIRYWRAKGLDFTAAELAAGAMKCDSIQIIDTEDPMFAKPGPMPETIAKFCDETGQAIPETPFEFARCIFDSLALAYSRTLRDLQDASGKEIDEINIVGGGSANELLNQLTADATGKIVYSGPAEATVLGNLVIQMEADGVISSLEAGRAMIANSTNREKYSPRVGTNWEALWHGIKS